MVFFDLGRTTTTSVILFGNFMLFRLVDGAVIGIALLLCVDQIDDFQHFMLNVVLVNECEDLVLHCWEVCNLRDRGPLVVVFIEQSDNEHA